MRIVELNIKGMTCPSCSASVAKSLDELEGISSKYINHATDSGQIEFDDSIISEDEIIAKINETHYKVVGKEHIGKEQIILLCPRCNNPGQMVPNTIFTSLLKIENRNMVFRDEKNYICMNPDCEIAYYSDKSSIPHSALRREIWFKKAAKKKVICYCNNIDKEQIKNAVVNEGLESWEDITALYRNKVIEKCELFNPTGLCCRKTFGKVVDKMKTDFLN